MFKMYIKTAFVTLALALSAAAHSHYQLSAREIAGRQAISKRCAVAAGAFTMERKKRSLSKRHTLLPRDTNVTIHTESPHFSTIQNQTCLLSTEIGAGPYLWPRADILRQDMREGQAGIPLYLDIGVLDVNTCVPAPNVLIDMWHCNATGSYSSFEALSPNTPFADLLGQLNKSIADTDDLHTEDSTFLRGMWPTDDNGVMEMSTIFPGFYVERSIHIHLRSHTNWTITGNGTIAASNIAHVTQIYFDEEVTQQVMAMEPYASHTEIERTANNVDVAYTQEMLTGWNPTIQIEPLDGHDIANGIVGYITLGINVTATSTAGKSLGFAK